MDNLSDSLPEEAKIDRIEIFLHPDAYEETVDTATFVIEELTQTHGLPKENIHINVCKIVGDRLTHVRHIGVGMHIQGEPEEDLIVVHFQPVEGENE